jgi:hypothetical protein
VTEGSAVEAEARTDRMARYFMFGVMIFYE